jgi:hypothetical protein
LLYKGIICFEFSVFIESLIFAKWDFWGGIFGGHWGGIGFGEKGEFQGVRRG